MYYTFEFGYLEFQISFSNLCFIYRQVALNVKNEKKMTTIYNVIGIIPGLEEPGKGSVFFNSSLMYCVLQCAFFLQIGMCWLVIITILGFLVASIQAVVLL